MERKSLSFQQTFLRLWIIIAIVLFLFLLIFIGTKDNVHVTSLRQQESVQEITDLTCQERPDPSAPAGLIREYRFTLPEHMSHETALNFYLFHQYAAVYVDQECVYRLEPSGQLPNIKTPGYNWVNVPIYQEDAGRTVTVEILPVYRGADDEPTRFILGYRKAVMLNQLKASWLKLMICEMLMFTGIVLIGCSLYYRKVYKQGGEITAFGVVALLMGIWRYTDSKFMPFLFPNHTILLFYMSFCCMMVGMIPMLISQKRKMNPLVYRSLLYIESTLCLVAAICQWTGILEVRSFIKLFHFMALVSFGFILYYEFRKREDEEKFHWNLERLGMAALILGLLLDCFFFYVYRTETRTAYMLMGLLVYIILSAFGMILLYQEQNEKIRRQEKQLVLSRISAMMGQIRSHFVFNVLNAISGMCKYDPEKADETIVCFSRYLRTNIDIMETDEPVPFRRVMEHMEDYIELEQVRFGERIHFQRHTPVMDFLIPPLILQPLVENSIRHGLLPKEEGGTLSISTWMEEDSVCVCLADDGVGFTMDQDDQRPGSVGLKNVRLRLQYMVGGTLELNSEPGNGTVAVIRIPKEKAGIDFS